MTRILLLSLSFLMFSVLAVAQTAIYGKVTDEETGEDLIYANIVLEKNGVFAAGASTDFEGNYSIPIDPGTYTVKISYTGYPDREITDVLVKAGQSTKLDIALTQGVNIETVIVTGYKVPLIEQDNTTQGGTLTSEQIRNLPTKNISALAATTAGLSQADEGEAITVRGSRSNATDYYIDGIRVRGSASMIPQSEIDQLQVITGGIEAQYGDVTGGIISITTKGPSAKFGGSVELETSEYLDDYGYQLGSFNLSGPILKKKETGESILGFRVAGQYRYLRDDDPPATQVFVAKDEVLEELAENPIRLVGGSRIAAAEFLTNDDVRAMDYTPNEEQTRIDLTGKLDARLSKAIDVTFTGSYSYLENQFTPGQALDRNSWQLLNNANNPTSFDTRYRGNFRFRHRLGGNGVATDASGETEKKAAVIQNAQYTLQFGYEKDLNDLNDPVHGENLFNYGYIGQFDREWTPVPTLQSNFSGAVTVPGTPFAIAHGDYQENFTKYTPGEINPGLVNYNNNIDVSNLNDFVVINGQFQADVTNAWDMWTNVNQIYNLSSRNDNDLYTFTANSSFDFLPGGSEKGRHSIQFGILYEQRFNRSYDINPRGLWQVADQQVNRHILGIDTSNVIGTFEADGFIGGLLEAVNGSAELDQFGTFVSEDAVQGNLFYKNVRDLNGASLNEYVNIDGLDPSALSLGMFAARELTDAFPTLGLNYVGYSYTGERLSNDVTFDDFFTARDANGIRTLPVAAYQPIYSAAYIQDKFTFKDIIFRVGLRVDRFDANTKVLKDRFSLYEIQTANEFYGGNLPTGVEGDFLVYTEDAGSDAVKAYRRGEQWFFADGSPANDGNVIFGTSAVFPRYKQTEGGVDPDIRSESFDVNTSFRDYEPQVNWMPRLAFSFPISDAANFFAHYDILVQRPPSNNFASALQYYYFTDRPDVNNPDLRPERTIDYEIGFQQKLSNSSAIKIAAYYKELRDMIQARTYLYVPIVGRYETSDNQDFGTVKGFTFQYDLRRTNNVQLTANYTLQFADGTGSSAGSFRGASARGIVRTLAPLSFDERHRLVTTLDYRYGSGKRYNGPQLMGKDIFANAGVNLQAIAVSGRPYTATTLANQFGGTGREGQINGARLPWNFTLNLRVDKSFQLTKPEATRPLSLNVYLRVQNLLDQRNILSVFSASGSPSDDGFLASPRGQQTVNNISPDRVESFLASYQWRILNPDFYSLPRRIFLGAEFFF